MKVKIKDLVRNDVQKGLQVLFSTHVKLSGNDVWNFIKFRKAVLLAGEEYQEAFKVIRKTFSEQQDNMLVVSAENVPLFEQEVLALNNKEVDLPDLELKVDHLKLDAFSADDLGGLAYLGVLTE